MVAVCTCLLSILDGFFKECWCRASSEVYLLVNLFEKLIQNAVRDFACLIMWLRHTVYFIFPVYDRQKLVINMHRISSH